MNESKWLTIALNTFICLTNSSWSLSFIKCSCISKVTTVLLSYYHPNHSRNPWWQPRVHMISFFPPCVVEGVTCTHMCSSFVLFTHKVHYWHNYIVLSSPCLPEEPPRGEKEATPWPPLPPPIRERLMVVVMMAISRTLTLLTTLLPPPLVSLSASIKGKRKVRVIVSYLSASIPSIPTDTESNFHIC